MKQSVLIVDDCQDMRELVSKVLEPSYDVVTVATSDEALAKAWEIKPHLIILDIMLEQGSGYELCSQIKSMEELKNTPVIFISSKTGANSRITGYKLGAVHYLEKPFEPEELRAVIQTVLNNLKTESVLETIDYTDISLNIPSQEVAIRGEKIHFTSSEFKIIHLLAKSPNKIFSRDYITNLLWPNVHVQNQNIDTHLSNLRKKLKPFSQYIKTIKSRGYILRI